MRRGRVARRRGDLTRVFFPISEYSNLFRTYSTWSGRNKNLEYVRVLGYLVCSESAFLCRAVPPVLSLSPVSWLRSAECVADVSWKPAAHRIIAFLRTRCSRSEVDVPNRRSNLRVS